jgi:hypothetical protein
MRTFSCFSQPVELKTSADSYNQGFTGDFWKLEPDLQAFQ